MNPAASQVMNDQPISSREGDRFERREFAGRIAKTIIERRDRSSLVVGLLGSWGAGKTSLLRLMVEELRNYKYVGKTAGGSSDEKLEPIVVMFNPWYFEDESQLIRSFYNTLSDAVRASDQATGTKVGVALKKYARIVSPLAKSLDPILTVLGATVPGGGLLVKANELISEGKLEALGEVLAPSLVELDELRNQVNTALAESDRRVVLLLDDIDRLDRREIYAVFKLLKLSADFERITYVVAFDPVIVAAALAETYGGDADAGTSFLEKIVQVPLYLPASKASDFQDLVYDGIDQAVAMASIAWSTTDRANFHRHFARGFTTKLSTPRAAKRYVMALEFVLPLLQREVNPVDFMLIEAFRIFYPQIYTLIRDNPDMFLVGPGAFTSGPEEMMDEIQAEGEREAAKFSAVMEQLPEEERSLVLEVLLWLFPRLQSDEYTFDNEADAEWARGQRIASGMHFYRYFRYTVPSDDIADQDFREFLQDLPTLGAEKIPDRLRQLAQEQRTDNLVRKLSTVTRTVPQEALLSLILGLTQFGNELARRDRQARSGRQYRWQIGRICTELLTRIAPRAERIRLAKQMLETATELTFAQILFKAIVESVGRGIRSQGVQELGELLVGRIEASAAHEPLHETYGLASQELYETWAEYGTRDAVQATIMPLFKRESAQAAKFILVFSSDNEEDEESGVITKYQYNQITRVVDPELLAEVLEHHYLPGIGDPSAYEKASAEPGAKAAISFLKHHSQSRPATAISPASKPTS